MPRPQIDTGKAHPARVYDFLLGGKDNYPVDQLVAESLPEMGRQAAKMNRAFMRRAVGWVAEQGVDQFLDIGTGIPTEPNLHQIAQKINPRARIVYTDNDPIVLRHAEALLISHPEGSTEYIEADVRRPDAIIDHARTTLDLDRPVALSLIGLLHFLPDRVDPYGIVRSLVGTLAPGSYLLLSQGASDLDQEHGREGASSYQAGGIELALRSRDEFGRFFEGLDLEEPGIVLASQWRSAESSQDTGIGLYAAVGRKP